MRWWFLIIAYLIVTTASAQTEQRKFRLEEINFNTGENVALDQKSGESVGMIKQINSVYEVYKDGTGILVISVPSDSLKKMKVRLQFLYGNKRHLIFHEPETGIVPLYIDKTIPVPVMFKNEKLAGPKHSYNSRKIADSLKISKIVYEETTGAIINFANLSVKQKISREDSLVRSIVFKYSKNPTLKPYATKLVEYFKNHEIINAWLILDGNFTPLSYFKTPNAFFEAKMLTESRDGIQLLSDSLKQAEGKNQFHTQEKETDNLKNLSNFIVQPQSNVDTSKILDLDLFYKTASRFVAQRTGQSSIKATPTFKPDILPDSISLVMPPPVVETFRDVRLKLKSVRRFKKFAKQHSEARRFFPNTFQTIELLKKDTNFKKLQVNISNDFNNFPDQLINWTELVDGYKKNDYLLTLKNFTKIYAQGKQDSVSRPFTSKSSFPTPHIDLLKVLSTNLRDTSANHKYIEYGDYSSLRNEGQKYFTYLLYRQQPGLFNLLQALQPGDQLQPTDDSLRPNENYIEFSRKVGSMIQELNTYDGFIKSDNLDLKTKAERLSLLYTAAYKLFYDGGLNRKENTQIRNYTANSVQLFESTRIKVPFFKQQLLKDMFVVALHARFDSLYRERAYKQIDTTLNKINSIATAYRTFSYYRYINTPENVKEFIEATALPPASFQISRHSPYSLFLQSFVGFKGSKDFGMVTFPIGMGFNKAIRKRLDRKNIHSFDQYYNSYFTNEFTGSNIFVYLQVMDLGNIFHLNFNHENSTPDKPVKAERLLSPGINFGYGFKNIPLTMMAGIENNADREGNRKWMPTLSLAIDFPILFIYRDKGYR